MRIKTFVSSILILMSVSISNAVLPQGFSLSVVTTGLNAAITIRFAPDGRMFFLEQYAGRVRTMSNVSGNYVLNPTPWATLTIDSVANTERGLLGIQFDPDFTTNHYVYIYHSVQGSNNNRVIRLTEDTTTNLAIPLSIVTVMEIVDSQSATNHNGGNLTFGPDTMLYITVGDGGGSPGGRSQDTTIDLGKILRVNPYSGLPLTFNPSMIYCYGVRNSFDMAWNPVNDVLYTSENGPNTDDEINRIVLGANYGWASATGYSTNTAFTNPIFDFSHTSTVAPTGICFYPASGNFPAEYQNNIFIVDVNYGNLWRFVLGTNNLSLDSIVSYEILTTVKTTGALYPGATDIEPGPDGALYIAQFNRIMKLSYSTGVENWMLFDKPVWKP